MKVNLPPKPQDFNHSAFVWPTWLNNIHGSGNLFGGVENGNFILDHLDKMIKISLIQYYLKNVGL